MKSFLEFWQTGSALQYPNLGRMKASGEAGNRAGGVEGERERMTESSFWSEGAKGLNKESINERAIERIVVEKVDKVFLKNALGMIIKKLLMIRESGKTNKVKVQTFCIPVYLCNY